MTYTPESFGLKGFAVVGGYALQPAWADGHGTGLYTFPYLQRLATEAASGQTP
ncbi:MAG: gamma-butyrobetaine hydroxylase-like domain-containing protein [Chthoniobacter sp.]